MKEVNEKNILHDEVVDSSDSIQHHGILGMKWGIRRDRKQQKATNDKRKAKIEADEEKFKTSKKKSVSKMSDDELRREMDRRRLENDYQKIKDDELRNAVTRLQLEKQYAELNPPKVSLGRKILEGVWPTVQKATLEAGGQLLKDALIKKGKDALGLDVKNEVEKAKEAYDIISYQVRAENLKKYGQEKPVQQKGGNNNDNNQQNNKNNNNKQKNKDSVDVDKQPKQQEQPKQQVDFKMPSAHDHIGAQSSKQISGALQKLNDYKTAKKENTSAQENLTKIREQRVAAEQKLKEATARLKAGDHQRLADRIAQQNANSLSKLESTEKGRQLISDYFKSHSVAGQKATKEIERIMKERGFELY